MADIEFGTFEAPEKVNPHIDVITKLSQAEDENAAIIVTSDVNEFAKDKFLIQRAANEIGKTARIRSVDESAVKDGKPDEDGNPTKTGKVKFTVTLTEKHKVRRGKKD